MKARGRRTTTKPSGTPRRSAARVRIAAANPDVAAIKRELAEAVEQQAAAANVLRVISRSEFDLHEVFNSLVEGATRLCHANASVLWRPNGATYHLAASYGVTAKFEKHLRGLALKPDGNSVVGRSLVAKKTIYVPDLAADIAYAKRRNAKDFGGYRGLLCVPLIRKGAAIGVLMVAHTTVRAFSKRQIALVTTFADQAVIAIENTRLLSELRQRTDDLSESLDRQTATSEVLQVISSSPGELEPVFQTLLENANSHLRRQVRHAVSIRWRIVPPRRRHRHTPCAC